MNSTLELEVTEVVQGEGALDIGADEYILTADEAMTFEKGAKANLLDELPR